MSCNRSMSCHLSAKVSQGQLFNITRVWLSGESPPGYYSMPRRYNREFIFLSIIKVVQFKKHKHYRLAVSELHRSVPDKCN